MSRLTAGITSGALAGAAGATALNAFTYAQQGITAAPASTTPAQTVTALADQTPGPGLPGGAEERENRSEALGPLAGYGVGIGVGALGGALRALGIKIPIGVAPFVLGLGAMALSDSVMTALKVTSPRSWTAKSVLQDAIPHVVYGATTVLTLHRMVDPHTVQIR